MIESLGPDRDSDAGSPMSSSPPMAAAAVGDNRRRRSRACSRRVEELSRPKRHRQRWQSNETAPGQGGKKLRRRRRRPAMPLQAVPPPPPPPTQEQQQQYAPPSASPRVHDGSPRSMQPLSIRVTTQPSPQQQRQQQQQREVHAASQNTPSVVALASTVQSYSYASTAHAVQRMENLLVRHLLRLQTALLTRDCCVQNGYTPATVREYIPDNARRELAARLQQADGGERWEVLDRVSEEVCGKVQALLLSGEHERLLRLQDRLFKEKEKMVHDIAAMRTEVRHLEEEADRLQKESATHRTESTAATQTVLKLQAEKDAQQMEVLRLQQEIMHCKMDGYALKNEIDVRAARVLEGVRATVGFVPGSIQREINILLTLAPPGAEKAEQVEDGPVMPSSLSKPKRPPRRRGRKKQAARKRRPEDGWRLVQPGAGGGRPHKENSGSVFAFDGRQVVNSGDVEEVTAALEKAMAQVALFDVIQDDDRDIERNNSAAPLAATGTGVGHNDEDDIEEEDDDFDDDSEDAGDNSDGEDASEEEESGYEDEDVEGEEEESDYDEEEEEDEETSEQDDAGMVRYAAHAYMREDDDVLT